MANGGTLTAAVPAQDNPVGITEKYIYIIRNYINDKVYIGQSVDPYKRFIGHIADSNRKKETSAIDGAIHKYGAENFYYEILEDKTANYNERERFWISFFNSKCPNGYNIMDGGEDPPIRYGQSNNKSKLSKDDISQIKRLLLNPYVSLREIANAFSVSYRTIKNLNQGVTYHEDEIDYPIRKFQCSGEIDNQLSPQIVNAIIYDLSNTDISMNEISKMYCVSVMQVMSINDGSVLAYKKQYISYPIRESIRMTDEKVADIKNELRRGVLSKNQIASKFAVSYSIVSNINSGRNHFDEDEVYPIKKHEGIYHFDESVWETIRSRLLRGDKPRTIAGDMNLPNVSMVHDINTGKTHVSDKYQYPIQKPKNRFSDETIRRITDEILNTNKSLSSIARELGINKSIVVKLKNGSIAKYRLPGYHYPLR